MRLITVILPTYNGIKYVKRSIESVLTQTYKDFDFLICDDFSQDGTWEYLKILDDDRIRVYRNESNKGLFPTLNFLIKETRTKWIHLWSQDDIMYSNCIDEEIKFIKKHPEVPFFFSQMDIIDKNDKLIKQYKDNFTNEIISEKHLIKVSVLAGSITGNIANTVIRKIDVIKVGGFDQSMVYSGDFDMWEKLSRGKNIGVINKALIRLREHNEQLSKNIKKKKYQIIEDKKIISRWVERICDEKIKRKAQRGIKWKINVMYCLWGIKILKQKEYKVALEYFKVLSRIDNLFFLFIRCVITKALNFLGIKDKFYYYLFYKNYYR
jgi:glycosyltransferase involved in cell wall biosynthesis